MKFNRPNRLEIAYRQAINRLLDEYFNIPTSSTLGEINARLVEFAQAANFFQNIPSQLASRMITMTLQQNAVNWRKAATQSSKGREIYSMLQRSLEVSDLGIKVNALIQENAKLIKTLPQEISYTIAKHIQTEQMKGVRAETIVKQLKGKVRDIKAYEVARLARTEVSKADTAITRVRAQEIGLNWYQWQTSEDARVRDSHRKMDKVLINWNDPPSPEELTRQRSQGHYNAGNIYNCRCIPLPIVTLDEIVFPAKIYSRGSIFRLTKKQFALMSSLDKRIAA